MDGVRDRNELDAHMSLDALRDRERWRIRGRRTFKETDKAAEEDKVRADLQRQLYQEANKRAEYAREAQQAASRAQRAAENARKDADRARQEHEELMRRRNQR